MTFAQNEKLFDQGKEQYKNGDFQNAITTWMQILNKGEHSANLYYNLGNAHYKLNHVGPSVYYYEKARQLAPNDSDIKNNLAFAENARVDAVEPLPKSIFKKWYHTVSGIFTFNGWAIIAVVFSFLFVLCFLLYYFSATEVKKRLFFTLSFISIALLLLCLTLAFATFSDFKNDKPAIIFAEEVEIKSEPNLGSAAAFVLHEGTKVQIIDQETNWYRVALADGKDGWIPASDLKQL